MIRTREEMRAWAHAQQVSTWAAATAGAMLESGLVEHLREPRTLPELASLCPAIDAGRLARCLDVLAASGVVVAEGETWRLAEGAAPFAGDPARGALAGEIRSSLMQAIALMDAAARADAARGWRHVDEKLLDAQGAGSGGFPGMFKSSVVPSLDDLGARLDRPGAAFLDVGVGVARLAIAMCRAWPALRVVGIDPFEAPLAIARINVARAELAERIELRRAGVEELRDEEAFDLAWLPTVFIPSDVVPHAMQRVRAALRPGGWMIVPTIGDVGSDLHRSVWALQNELWGGPVLVAADVEPIARAAGFSTVRAMPSPGPWAPSLVVARRS
jgi:2-polyprenyl-3-methyl-5-hydroxy-6-metoxy-1,4-benzoquinol methylase